MKRRSEQLLALLFFGILLALMLATILLPKERYSYYENRQLSDYPELTVESVLSGQLFDELETMFCDYAAGRSTLLRMSTWCDVNLFRRPVVNDVVVTDDILLPELTRMDVNEELIAQQAELVAQDNAQLQALVESYGGAYCYVAVPCQYAYYEEEYPAGLYDRSDYTAAELKTLTDAMGAQDVNFLDMGPVFDALGHLPEFSSRVDNHYGLLGAYETYRAAAETIRQHYGLTLDVPERDVEVTFSALPNPYMGSRTRKLMGVRGNDEHLLMARFIQPIDFTRWNNGTQVDAAVYAMPADDTTPVLYSFYMGGDIAETRLDTQRPDKPNALIFGDSFTNAVECLAYYSFDELRSLDLRHYKEMKLREYIALYRPEVVICIRDYESLLDRGANGDLS